MRRLGLSLSYSLVSFLVILEVSLPARNVTAQKNRSSQSRHLWAVVIGLSRYQALPEEQQLKFADADAQAFYNFIRSQRGGGFPASNIQLLLNEDATSASVRRYLGTWLTRNVKKGDIVYIYFAGHGMAEAFGLDKRAYLVTYDSDPQDLNTTAVSMDEVKTYVEVGLAEAAQVLFITDCCRAGYLGRYRPRTLPDELPVNRYLEEIGKTAKGFLRVLASRADQYSFEEANLKHGVFTYYLLRGLNGEADTNPKDQVVRAGELVSYLSIKVPEATNYRQHPRANESYDDMLPLAILDAAGPEAQQSWPSPTEAASETNSVLTIINAEPGTEIYFPSANDYCGRVLKSSPTRVMKPVLPGTYRLLFVTKADEESSFTVRLAPGKNLFDAARGKLVSYQNPASGRSTASLFYDRRPGILQWRNVHLLALPQAAANRKRILQGSFLIGAPEELLVVGVSGEEVYLDDVFVGLIAGSGELAIVIASTGVRKITVIDGQGNEESVSVDLGRHTSLSLNTKRDRVVFADYERATFGRLVGLGFNSAALRIPVVVDSPADFYKAVVGNEPLRAWDYFKRIQRANLVSVTEQMYLREKLLVALENAGQRLILHYLNSENELPEETFVRGAEIFKTVAELAPDDPKLREGEFFCQGSSLFLRKKYGEAAQKFKEAIELLPSASYVHNALAHALKPVNLDEAEAAFRKASNLAPLWIYPRSNLISLYLTRGDDLKARDAARAMDWYDKAETNLIASGTKSSVSLLLAHRGYSPARAESTSRRALKANQKSAVLHAQLGDLYERNSKIQQSIREYKTALELDPGGMRNLEAKIKKLTTKLQAR